MIPVITDGLFVHYTIPVPYVISKSALPCNAVLLVISEKLNEPSCKY